MSFNLSPTGIIGIVAAAVFLASFLIQVFYYLAFYLRLILHKYNDAITDSAEPVSVIICARDEAHNLERNLPLILEQDYHNYEVIVVNDTSQDNTEEVLERLGKKYNNLRTTRIKKDQKFRHGKKLALTIGLKSAKNEWVLLTDADCRPASPLWISQMQKHFVSPNEVVLGYGGYERKRGLLNKLVRFDTFFIALQYFSFALSGLPYMGVGRNLAYKRSLFFRNKGFASHLKIESGDDDLFINEVANKNNTAAELSYLSHTLSSPPINWGEWFKQKRRHLTTGFHYKTSTRFLLGLEIVSRFLFYASFVVLLIIDSMFLYWVIALFFLRLIISVSIFYGGMKRLNAKKLLLFSPLFEIGILFINIFCVVVNFITQKRSRWR